jgi:dephospho-CoA kinase
VPLVLGLAGKYCSGKNALVSYLSEQGFSEIDVDRVGHRCLDDVEVKKKILAAFGGSVFDEEGRIDRRALGGKVFRRRRDLLALETIIHPPMVREVQKRLQQISGPVVINAAILFRMGLDRLCTAVICVRAPLCPRLKRARRRDGISRLEALRRMRTQRGICPKLNRNGVDIYYVDNDRGLEHLYAQTRDILRAKGHKAS